MPRASRPRRAPGKQPSSSGPPDQPHAGDPEADRTALLGLLEPLVASQGCDLEDLVVGVAGRRRVVRVVIDRAGGLPLDVVAELSRQISAALDADDVLGEHPYVLEVSSPGVDRPLRLPRHWRANVGRLVEVTTALGESITARVRELDESDPDDPQVVLDGESGAVRLPLSAVSRAVVQVEFTHLEDLELDVPLDPPESAEETPAEAPESAETGSAGADPQALEPDAHERGVGLGGPAAAGLRHDAPGAPAHEVPETPSGRAGGQ